MKSVRKGFRYYAKAANAGRIGGRREVGSCFQAGKETEIDLVRAAKHFKKAAEAGDAEALYKYGAQCYGYGVEKNAKIAVDLVKIAVNARSLDALLTLGDFYCYGSEVRVDAERAFSCYKAAAEK